jgi:hypothetical protein
MLAAGDRPLATGPLCRTLAANSTKLGVDPTGHVTKKCSSQVVLVV